MKKGPLEPLVSFPSISNSNEDNYAKLIPEYVTKLDIALARCHVIGHHIRDQGPKVILLFKDEAVQSVFDCFEKYQLSSSCQKAPWGHG